MRSCLCCEHGVNTISPCRNNLSIAFFRSALQPCSCKLLDKVFQAFFGVQIVSLCVVALTRPTSASSGQTQIWVHFFQQALRCENHIWRNRGRICSCVKYQICVTFPLLTPPLVFEDGESFNPTKGYSGQRKTVLNQETDSYEAHFLSCKVDGILSTLHPPIIFQIKCRFHSFLKHIKWTYLRNTYFLDVTKTFSFYSGMHMSCLSWVSLI